MWGPSGGREHFPSLRNPLGWVSVLSKFSAFVLGASHQAISCSTSPTTRLLDTHSSFPLATHLTPEPRCPSAWNLWPETLPPHPPPQLSPGSPTE